MTDAQTPPNPLLAKLRIPGATYRLPSHGLFYRTGELSPDVKNGEVEIYPMTALDEIILQTPDKLLSGKAILEVFSRCIPQVLKPEKLLAKDVDFLMVALRAVSFGDIMEVNFKHTCDGAKEQTYAVDLQHMIRTTKVVDPTTVQSEYHTSMPNGQEVTLQPLTYQHIVDLYQTTAMIKDDEMTQEEAEKLILNALTSVVRSVDGVEDPAQIREWVASIPLGWKRKLERTAQDVSQWGVEFMSSHKCKDCGESIDIPITANPVSFFM